MMVLTTNGNAMQSFSKGGTKIVHKASSNANNNAIFDAHDANLLFIRSLAKLPRLLKNNKAANTTTNA